MYRLSWCLECCRPGFITLQIQCQVKIGLQSCKKFQIAKQLPPNLLLTFSMNFMHQINQQMRMSSVSLPSTWPTLRQQLCGRLSKIPSGSKPSLANKLYASKLHSPLVTDMKTIVVMSSDLSPSWNIRVIKQILFSKPWSDEELQCLGRWSSISTGSLSTLFILRPSYSRSKMST